MVILGPGRVGASFGHWLLDLGLPVTLSGRRRTEETHRLVDRGAGWQPLEALSADDGDCLLLTVSDGVIEPLAGELAKRSRPGVVLHASGHHDAAVLGALRDAGCATGSMHPLRAFVAVSREVEDAAGTTFAIDGDPAALAWGRDLARKLGGQAIELNGDRRVLYHLAACLAAGGVVTVLAAVDRLCRSAGLTADLMSSYLHLTRGAVEQIPLDGSALGAAITGPAARGDEAVLQRQIEAVRRTAPDLEPFLVHLNQLTATLGREAPSPGSANVSSRHGNAAFADGSKP